MKATGRFASGFSLYSYTHMMQHVDHSLIQEMIIIQESPDSSSVVKIAPFMTAQVLNYGKRKNKISSFSKCTEQFH